jgi:hypothetical protein
MVKHYAKRVGVNIEGFGAHSLRATAATNALDHEADIAKVQVWIRAGDPPVEISLRDEERQEVILGVLRRHL